MHKPLDPEQERELGKLVARAWKDSSFCRRLIENPAAVLREAGIVLGLAVVVVAGSVGEAKAAELKNEQESAAVYEIVIPLRPVGLKDTDLSAKAIEEEPGRGSGCC